MSGKCRPVRVCFRRSSGASLTITLPSNRLQDPSRFSGLLSGHLSTASGHKHPNNARGGTCTRPAGLVSGPPLWSSALKQGNPPVAHLPGVSVAARPGGTAALWVAWPVQRDTATSRGVPGRVGALQSRRGAPLHQQTLGSLFFILVIQFDDVPRAGGPVRPLT